MKAFQHTLTPNSSLDIYHPAFRLAQVCLFFFSLYNALLMCLHSRRHIRVGINSIAFESLGNHNQFRDKFGSHTT